MGRYGLLLFLFVLIGLGGTLGGRAAAILVAYKAKQVCSGVFVAGREVAVVAAELEVDDLELLRYVDATVDASAKVVTASTLGLITRRAAYRGSTGCALVFNDTPARSPATRGASAPATAALSAEADERLAPVLARAFAEPDANHLRRTRAVVVVHHGQIVGERYAGGVDSGTPLLGWSMTKSVTNAARVVRSARHVERGARDRRLRHFRRLVADVGDRA